MEHIDFYRNYEYIKNFFNYRFEKRAHVASGTVKGRMMETMYLLEIYVNDVLVDTFIVDDKALAIANAKWFVRVKKTNRMCAFSSW